MFKIKTEALRTAALILNQVSPATLNLQCGVRSIPRHFIMQTVESVWGGITHIRIQQDQQDQSNPEPSSLRLKPLHTYSDKDEPRQGESPERQ